MATDQLVVAPGNEGQAAAWDGDEGRIWAEHADFYDAAVRHHHARLMAKAAISTGETVLDLGCGNGQVSCDAAVAAAPATVIGIDLSSAMIDTARRVAADRGLGNVAFVHGDAQRHPFARESIDVAVSRYGTMFFGDQVAAFTNVRRALRPGGRLVMLSWQAPQANEWISSISATLTLGRPLPPPPADAPGPFTHADPRRVEDILTAAGLAEVACVPFAAPMYFGRDAAEGYDRLIELLSWTMDGLDDSERSDALGSLRELLADHETPDGVAFGSASWLITAAV